MVSETENEEDRSSVGIGDRLVTDLIHALNMAAAKLAVYPDGHPFVVESFGKVENLFQMVFNSKEQLVLKIAKDKVIFGSAELDPGNSIFQRFAQILFTHGIVGLVFERGIQSKELMAFDRIISKKRNDVLREGGIRTLLNEADIRHIQIRLIDYGLFRKVENFEGNENRSLDSQSAGFWEIFVNGLFEERIFPLGKNRDSGFDIEPETLALMLNQQHLYSDTIAREGFLLFFKDGVERYDYTSLLSKKELSERVFKFIKSLNDELRKSFMEAFFNSLLGDEDALQDILEGLPDEIILDALEKHTTQGLYIPPNILRLSQRFASASITPNLPTPDKILNDYPKNELIDRLKIIFKEDETERFIPPDYQKMLQDIIVSPHISLPDVSKIPEIEKTLSDHSIAASRTAIIVHMIASLNEGEVLSDAVLQSLKTQCLHLIREGDFDTVFTVIETIGEKPVCLSEGAGSSSRSLMDVIFDKVFTYEMLKMSAEAGKGKHPSITKLITWVGPASIEPLLDRLAEEENKGLRFYYLNALQRLGGAVKDHVMRRLRDSRWYFIRNLLIILRGFNDPSVIDAASCLCNHHHVRVRQELLHTLLVLGDAKADKLLLQELNTSDVDRCLKAVKLAGKTSNQEVKRKLVGFLNKRGFDKDSFEIKKASVEALADQHDPKVLPELFKCLKSFSLLSRKRSRSFKVKIIESFERYPAEAVAPLLQQIIRRQPLALANRARHVMEKLKAERHGSA